MNEEIMLGDLGISFNDSEDAIVSTSTEIQSTEIVESLDSNVETLEIESKIEPVIEVDPITENDVENNRGYFNFLKQNNLLVVEDDFDFDGSEEKLREAQEQTMSNYQRMALDAIMNHLPEDFRNVLTYTLNGGSDYKKFLETPTFDNTTPEGQASLITAYYKNELKWDDNKIERYLQKLDEDELEEESKDIQVKLEDKRAALVQEAIENQKQQQLEEEKEKAKRIQQITGSIENANFLEAKRKNTVKNFIFNSVRKTDGMKTEFQRVLSLIHNNPNHLIQLADLLVDYDKEKGIAYERFEKKAETKLTQSLKENLNKTIKTKIEAINKTSKTNDIDWSKFINN